MFIYGYSPPSERLWSLVNNISLYSGPIKSTGVWQFPFISPCTCYGGTSASFPALPGDCIIPPLLWCMLSIFHNNIALKNPAEILGVEQTLR